MIRVMLLDNQEIVRKGIRSIIDSQPDCAVVGEAGDGIEALRMVEELNPNVIVLELMLRGTGGLELLQQLHNRSDKTGVVVLSMYANEVYVFEAFRAGAQAYVLKESAVDDLLAAIHRVALGQTFLCTDLAQHAFDIYSRNNNHADTDPYETLSSRERQILHLIVEDNLSSSLIAKRLFISRRTVETHRANLMRKLGVSSYHSLIRYGIQKGILPPAEEEEKEEVYSATPALDYAAWA